MEAGTSSQAGLMQCFCHICKGLNWFHRSTVWRHMNNERFMNPTTHESLDNESEFHTTEDDFQMDEPMEERYVDDEEMGGAYNDDVLPDYNGVENPSVPMSLNKAISSQIVKLQIMWDEAHIPTGVQGQMLEQMFGGLDKMPKPHKSGELDHTGLSLGKLLTLTDPFWKEDLGQFDAPSSWYSLKKMYSILGSTLEVMYRFERVSPFSRAAKS